MVFHSKHALLLMQVDSHELSMQCGMHELIILKGCIVCYVASSLLTH